MDCALTRSLRQRGHSCCPDRICCTIGLPWSLGALGEARVTLGSRTLSKRTLAALSIVLALILLGPASAQARVVGWSIHNVPGASGAQGLHASANLAAWVAVSGQTAQLCIWKPGDVAPQLLGSAFQWLGNSGGYPQVSGDRVAWTTEEVNGTSHVFTWKSGEASPTQLAVIPLGGADPRVCVSDDRVAWSNGETGDDRIFTWKSGDATPAQLISGYGTGNQLQGVSGDRVVWVSWGLGLDSRLFTWKGGDTTPTLVPGHSTGVRYDNVSVSGDRIVWVSEEPGHDQLFIWKAGDAQSTQLTHYAANDEGFGSPQISGDRVVWRRTLLIRGQYLTQILTMRVGEKKPTQMPGYVGASDIDTDGSSIAWQGYLDPGVNDGHVFIWTAGDVAPTVLAGRDAFEPRVAGTRVYWDAAASSGSVFTATLAREATRLTQPAVSPSSPSRRENTTVSASLSPGAGAALGVSQLCLFHYETRTVSKLVNGKTRKVKEHYWRGWGTVRMSSSASGRLTWKGRLTLSGRWRVYVQYLGSFACKPSTSGIRFLSVR